MPPPSPSLIWVKPYGAPHARLGRPHPDPLAQGIFMYTNILVPVDGSPTSDRGLGEAVKLAKLTGARLRLIHVVDELIYAAGMDSLGAMTAEMMGLLQKGGEQILKTCKARVEATGVPVDTALSDSFAGRVCDLVVEEATKWHADLIVLGTHGRRGVGRVFMGSDAEQIVRLAPTPVLLVRASDVPPAATPAPLTQAR
jgi:nucleotide-binding universal stress UspA family protein